MSKVYPVGRVYALRSKNSDDVYIGSTFNPLYKRINGHKGAYKQYNDGKKCSYVTSFKIIDQGEPYIELIEQYKNLTKEQLNKYEGEHIRKTQCVNKCIMGRTNSEYCKDHRQLRNEQGRNSYQNCKPQKQEYYKNNIESIKKRKTEIIECECGSKFQRTSRAQHLKSEKHKKYIESH